MTAEIILLQTDSSAALAKQQEELIAARATLAERTAELNALRTALKIFEDRYFREVGTLYADLDELEAGIAEREARLYDSDTARTRAAEARERADGSRDAASEAAEVQESHEPSSGLKTLFREVAKRIHPDFARNEAEAQYLTLLMARANQAYRRGDSETLHRMLEDERELHDCASEDGTAAEMLRTTRQIRHVRRDVSALEAERYALLSSEIAGLQREAEVATVAQRDLLSELATSLREQIADARSRLQFVERQMFAHGR